MNNEEMSEDSDSSDEDYVPDEKPHEVLSEIESDGDLEDDLDTDETGNKANKRTKSSGKRRKKQKTIHTVEKEIEEVQKPASEEERKKIADDIWADFMKDTGFQSKNAPKVSDSTIKTKPVTSQSKPVENKPKTKTVTQIFEFAGEEVKVEKEVAENSSDLNKFSTSRSNKQGLGGLLSQLGKKNKISTLEKSKLDWDRFKKDENIEEELQTHNKGRDGYLEKQDFLNRADLRRFEIEKKIRTNERNKRVNNAL